MILKGAKQWCTIKTQLKLTFFLSFQLECCALGPRVTDHSFKRPEPNWAEETERKENVPVGSTPCRGGSSGETAGQKEVRLAWLFHFGSSGLVFWLLQTSALWGNTKQRFFLIFFFIFSTRPGAFGGFSKPFECLRTKKRWLEWLISVFP